MVNIQNIKRVIQWTSKKNSEWKICWGYEKIFFPRRHTDDYMHMKRCSTSQIIWKMQIKTTIKYHFTSVRMAITKKIRNGKWRFEEKWTCILVGMLIGAATTENSMEIPKQFKNRASIWISKSTPGCLSEKKWKH